MNTIGTCLFELQLLTAEMIFMYPADKRARFGLRFLSAALVYLCFGWLLPPLGVFHYHPIYQLIRILLLFAGSIGVMAFSFYLRGWPLFSLCVAGYAVQHIAYHVCAMISHTTLFTGFTSNLLSRINLIEICFFPVIYLLMFLGFGLFCAKKECWKKADARFVSISFITVFICIGVTRLTRYLHEMNTISVSIYAILCCFLALVVQLVLVKMVDLQNENATMQAMWKEDRRQFELSKKTIDLINIKSHDLKHKMAGLKGRLPDEEVNSIREAVRIYDSYYKTGNEALDVLLTESTLHCGAEGILLTFTGNGKELSFMNVTDVYSLFGNAISNAVEAVLHVEDPEKRLVDIVLERCGSMVNISVSNYFCGLVRMVDGLPETTKEKEEGYHGFGMKSMRLLAEKYGGGLSVEVQGDLFSLDVYLFSE